MLLWLLVLAALYLWWKERTRGDELARKVDALADGLDILARQLRDLVVSSRAHDAGVRTKDVDVSSAPLAESGVAQKPSAAEQFDPERFPAKPVQAEPPATPRPEPLNPEPLVVREPQTYAAAPRRVDWSMSTSAQAEAAPPPPNPPAPPPLWEDAGGHQEGGGGGFRRGIDWERFVGVKLFSWIAAIALVVAGVYFLKYSMDHGWLAPPIRMAIGIATGMTLLVVCELRVARRYAVTANALDAAGIAILFSTFFAAHTLWRLVNAPTTFALLALVTATAVMLSIRRESLFIATLGLLGGFSTPALISTGENNPVGLFGYLLVLNAGLAWVAYRKRWPLLTAASLLFTTLYQWGWVDRFLTSGQLPLAIGIFLVFPVLSFASLIFGERRADANDESRAPSKWESIFARSASIAAALPLAFAVYLATVPAYGSRFALLFGFLLVLDIGLAAIALFRGPQWLHLAGAAATVMTWVSWLYQSYVPQAWPWVLVLIAPFVALYLATPWIAERLRRPLMANGVTDRAVYAAPVLLFVFPVLVAVEPRVASPFLLFGALLALLVACAWFAIERAEGPVHFIAAVFALATQALWSAKYLIEPRLIPALVVYLVLGMFYIAVPLLARRLGRSLEPRGAGGFVVLVSIALLFFIAGGSVASSALWGLGLLLLILNVGMFAEASAAHHPLLVGAALVLSWLVLGVWWATAAVAVALVPALTVVAGFALLALAGSVWAHGRAEPDQAPEFEQGAFLGLAGHLFLLFVASRADLSIPPWPMLGVLMVLNIGVGTAALYMRNGWMWVAALVATPLVLAVWLRVATQTPWPTVALTAGITCAGLAFVWRAVARRAKIDPAPFDMAPVVATLLAQGIAVLVIVPTGVPSLPVLIAANLILLGAAFVLGSAPTWRFVPVVSVVLAGIAASSWQAHHVGPSAWRDHLWFATPLYLFAMAYPLIARRKIGTAIEPYVAAVVASVLYFFVARNAIVAAGYEHVIGALPVVQGMLVSVLLIQLLRSERPGARTINRLALVAGAALGFITLAIPLQLDRQWITIAFALEGAALGWLYWRIPHRGLLLFSSGLFAVVFARLALNPAVFDYHARSDVRVWNWYLYAYLVCAGAMFAGARFLSRTEDRVVDTVPRISTLLPGSGAILLFLLLNIEIADFYAVGDHLTFNFLAATLAQDLTYTLGWALFAVGMLATGIVMANRPARVAAIGLLVVTIGKAFLHDLARLGGLYRVMSFVGLAVSLLLVAVAIQRFVLGGAKGARPIAPDAAA